ncbi:MAG: tRNA (adenosine(37)-N6)-threonylcarbamoyltransferase complex transferase subunit TsaD [Candidatus Taylorbacteria bacterium]
MVILGIETSCDETAICLIETGEITPTLNFKVLGDELISQVNIHEHYGGVFPMMAKREHGKNLIPLFLKLLKNSADSRFMIQDSGKENPKSNLPTYKLTNLQTILDREPELGEQFMKTLVDMGKPAIDAIAITEGPGLEPALWVGINFARALSALWDIPVIPVNHMEGHIVSALVSAETADQRGLNADTRRLISKENTPPALTPNTLHLTPVHYPALALLISGGHTELVLIKKWKQYEIIGQTRDDAVGEAFDKVARILGLPYPGGPHISALAEKNRLRPNLQTYHLTNLQTVSLPRPMLHSKDYDFSFSGLKTAVLYLVRKITKITPKIKQEISMEFENAVTEVLIAKTERAIQEFGIETLILGGGVIANNHLRKAFDDLGKKMNVPVLIPPHNLTTDNALMIALAGAFGSPMKNSILLSAKGNLRIDK